MNNLDCTAGVLGGVDVGTPHRPAIGVYNVDYYYCQTENHVRYIKNIAYSVCGKISFFLYNLIEY